MWLIFSEKFVSFLYKLKTNSPAKVTNSIGDQSTGGNNRLAFRLGVQPGWLIKTCSDFVKERHDNLPYTYKKTAALSALSTPEFAHPHRLTQKEDAPDAPHVPGQKTGDNYLQTIKSTAG